MGEQLTTVTVVEQECHGCCWKGNFGWAFMQSHDYCYAKIVYKCISIEAHRFVIIQLQY